ncbi:agamous-like MADS-box protein AGL80 [Carica papaya]|uniref:agamous-like MADS-box protein AGL80 n=1 Tax=Carica papaya TaxID=3649 RepID=UPI000B8D022A|nr:agamous-like MADS-box protein AGL80 [Carica papaya]
MTRKKVKLTYITNNSAKKATFKKRKKELMKKVCELSTLCDVKACAIIYSLYDSQPNLWFSSLGAQHMLVDFKRMPEMEQSKKMVNQKSFLHQKIIKVTDQLKKQCNDNREKEITDIMIYSRDLVEYAKHLAIVLGILRRAKLYAKFSRCDFWLDQIAFLANIVSKDGVSVDPAKVETVVK